MNYKKFINTTLAAVLSLGMFVNLTPLKAEEELDNTGQETEDIIEEETQEVPEVIEEELEKQTIQDVSNEEDNDISKIDIKVNGDKVALNEGVDTIEVNVTTLEEAFPDTNFRTLLAIEVFSISDYDDTLDKETIIDQSMMNLILDRKNLNGDNLNITSLEGMQHFVGLQHISFKENNIEEINLQKFVNLKSIGIQKNKIKEISFENNPGLISFFVGYNLIEKIDLSNNMLLEKVNVNSNPIDKIDLSNNLNLTTVQVNDTNINALDVSHLENLTTLEFYNTDISDISINELAKSKIVTLYYRSTNVNSIDLTGFDKLKNLGITKSTNGDLSKVTNFYITNGRSNFGMVRLTVDAGGLSWDPTTGYYNVAENSNSKYAFNIHDKDGKLLNTPVVDFSEKAIIDDKGNMIFGISTTDVKADGTIELPNGGKIATRYGIVLFEDEVSIKEGIIKTSGKVTIERNTTDEHGANIGGNKTEITPNTEFEFNTKDNNLILPKGTEIVNNDGHMSVILEGGFVNIDGTLNSGGEIITIPVSEVNNIVKNSNGSVVYPEGSKIVSPDGAETTHDSIIVDVDGNIVTFPEIFNDLFKDSSLIKDDLTQGDIDNVSNEINQLPDGQTKTDATIRLKEAQDQLDNNNKAKESVDGMFDDKGTIVEELNTDRIQEAKDTLDDVKDTDLKDALQEKIEDAEKQLQEREDAKKKVDDLTDGDGKIKDEVTDKDIEDAKDAVDKLPEGPTKDDLINKIKDIEEQLKNRVYKVLVDFVKYTGKETISITVDGPFHLFESVSVNGVIVDPSNYVVTKGSTVVTFTDAYLKTLKNGKYEVAINFSNKEVVKSVLEVDVKEHVPSIIDGSESNTKPSTGIAVNNVMTYTVMIAVASLVVMLMKKRSKKISVR